MGGLGRLHALSHQETPHESRMMPERVNMDQREPAVSYLSLSGHYRAALIIFYQYMLIYMEKLMCIYMQECCVTC